MPNRRPLTGLVLGACVLGGAACGSASAAPATPAAPARAVPARVLEVHRSPKLTSVESPRRDALGRPVQVACVTCHSLKPARGELPQAMEELKEFHAGLTLEHGENRCATCHVAGDVQRLRLADGRTVPIQDALKLCQQCHGPQTRDYLRGSHGGMTGMWAAARVKNHCVDCHDPHQPRFQPTWPVLYPHDRGTRAMEARTADTQGEGGAHD